MGVGENGRLLLELLELARRTEAKDFPLLGSQINGLLVELRSSADKAAVGKLLHEALDGQRFLPGLVDRLGRPCRAEAVETLIACGFPYALEVAPEDLSFARLPPAKPWRWKYAAGALGCIVGGMSFLAGSYGLIATPVMLLGAGGMVAGLILVGLARYADPNR